MVTVKEGSHVHQLMQLLAVAGEFPTASLHLLGNERVIKELVHRWSRLRISAFHRTNRYYEQRCSR